MSNQDSNQPPPPRKRGLTSLTLGWLAEKLRRTEAIKEQVKNGSYKVDPEKVAAAIMNKS